MMTTSTTPTSGGDSCLYSTSTLMAKETNIADPPTNRQIEITLERKKWFIKVYYPYVRRPRKI